MVQRRASGVPLEYVVGWAEFCGLRIRVAPGVFIPRRRTEALAREAAHRTRPGAAVVDLCCGSGAIGLAVQHLAGPVDLYLADISAAAVACARDNLGAAGTVYQGDLFAALPDALRGRVDVLIANVPYVPTPDLPMLPGEARHHEPVAALDGGADGLVTVARVAGGCSEWLRPGGALLMEVGARQVDTARALLRRAGLQPRAMTLPDWGSAVLVGIRPAA